MKDGKFDLKIFLNNFEVYAATLCFFVLTVLLTLLGQTLRNRARAQIIISHPNFRDELKDEYGKLYVNSKSLFFMGWSALYRLEETV